jgi:uncharacterized protein YndB with AHSA1/START domain
MTDSSTSQGSVVVERTFDAPIELVWQMWTEPEHFRAWYGPDGVSLPVVEMDVRVGGTRRICMEVPRPDGPMQMWFTGEYREVVPPERLVYSEATSHGHGDVDTEVHVELEDLGGRTRMVMTHVGVPEGSPGAAGWTMAFDKLTTRLARP